MKPSSDVVDKTTIDSSIPYGWSLVSGIDPDDDRDVPLLIGVKANGRGWGGGGGGGRIESPKKRKNGTLIFEDWPDFRPNLTPEDILRAGSFGGGYFRDIYSGVTGVHYKNAHEELPESWIEGLDSEKYLRSTTYDKTINRYGVGCGAKQSPSRTDPFGQFYWESKDWIRPQDPYGWFQWYCRFYRGRRSDDDGRQIRRWLKCAGPRGRWKRNLIAKVLKAGTTYNDRTVSPVVRQTLQHWAYRLTEEDFIKDVPEVQRRGASYFPRAEKHLLKTKTPKTTTAETKGPPRKRHRRKGS